MTAPQDAGADPSNGAPANIGLTVQEIQANANRLGLTWRIVPATVGAQGTSEVGYIGATIDGDDALSSVVSLVGWVPPGARVMVLIVPPTNKYIVGYLPLIPAQAETVYASDIDPGTTASASFVLPTGQSIGVAFVAPYSGKVRIHWSAEHSHSVANGWAIASPNVRYGSTIGSGAVFFAANDNVVSRCRNALAAATGGDKTISNFYLLTGLTPGSSYNVQLYVRTASGGTATYEFQTVMVEPV